MIKHYKLPGKLKEIHSIVKENIKKQLNGNFNFFFFLNIFLISYDTTLQFDSNDLNALFNALNNKGNIFNS